MIALGKNKVFLLQNNSLIRWAGSKRKLLPVLKENVPKSFERYIEPFCGSACLFFELGHDRSLLSDINFELINAFSEIKANKNLRSQLIKLPDTKGEYYKIRSLEPSNLNKTERAIRFLYLNRYCFNGVYRTNMAGKFNVPRGTRTGSFPSEEVFNLTRNKLCNTDLVVADYTETLSKLKKGDFVYIDPPYAKSNKFTGEYGPGSFNVENLPSFFGELHGLNKKGVKFLFSYRACEQTIKLLSKDFTVSTLFVKRHVAGFKTTWNEVEEILVKNYD